MRKFHNDTNTWRDFRICISVPLIVNHNSSVPWAFRVSWIKCLTTRAKKTFSAVYPESEVV